MLNVVVHVWSTSVQEDEAEGSGVRGWLGPHHDTSLQKEKSQEENDSHVVTAGFQSWG